MLWHMQEHLQLFLHMHVYGFRFRKHFGLECGLDFAWQSRLMGSGVMVSGREPKAHPPAMTPPQLSLRHPSSPHLPSCRLSRPFWNPLCPPPQE